jgi:hypothetical protein
MRTLPKGVYFSAVINFICTLLVITVYVILSELAQIQDKFIGLNFGTVVTVGLFSFITCYLGFKSYSILTRIVSLL